MAICLRIRQKLFFVLIREGGGGGDLTSAHVLFGKKNRRKCMSRRFTTRYLLLYRIKFSINYFLLLLLLCSPSVIGHRIAYKCDTTTPPFVFTTAHACVRFVLSYIIIITRCCWYTRSSCCVRCFVCEYRVCVSVSQANKQD